MAKTNSDSTQGSNAIGVASGDLFASCPFCGCDNIRIYKMTPLSVAFIVAQCMGKDCKVEMSQGMDLKTQPEEFWRRRLAERWNRRANDKAQATPTRPAASTQNHE